MKRTTMTVAAFLAVAAVSYAAKPVNGGNTVTISKGGTTVTETFTLKKGTYEIKVSGISSNDNFAIDGAELLDGKYTVNDVEKNITFKVDLAAPAGENGQNVTITFVPVTKDWTDFLAEQQQTINNIMAEASNLGKGDGEYGTDAEKQAEAGWRTSLIERISAIQAVKNACGVEQYNEWLEGKLTLNKDLTALKGDVNHYTENLNAFNFALGQYATEKAATNGKLNTDNLTALLNGLNAEDQKLFKATYDQLKKDIDNLEENAWAVYIQENAAESFATTKLNEQLNGLKSRIDNLSEAINSGSGQLANWAAVDGAVTAAINIYNSQFNELYSQLASANLPIGYGFDIYQDYYEKAVAELNAVLAKITAVKTANDNAKKAYDNADINKKPEINGLDYYTSNQKWTANNAAWADDNFAAELTAVYDKYILTGDKDVLAAGLSTTTDKTTLRGAYRAHMQTIASLSASLSDFDDAIKDADTDKDGKKISDYYTGKVNEIKSLITALEEKANEANTAHTITTFNIGTAGKSNIDTKKTFLDTQLAEYTNYVATRNIIKYLEETTFKNAKDKVAKKIYVDFNGNERFSNAHITTAIADFKAEARKNYKVEDDKKETLAANFKSGACVTTNTKINGYISTWQNSVVDAYDKYKAIYDAIQAYNWEIDGRAKAENVTEIIAWNKIVLDENVTVGNKVPSTDTYGARKKAADLIIADAGTKLAEAMAVAKNDPKTETDFTTKLGLAYAEEGSVSNKTIEIRGLKASYATDAPVWQQKTSHQAAKDAKAESESLLKASQAEINKITDYQGIDYGIEAAKTLNGIKAEIQDEIDLVNEKINKVNIPDSYEDFKQETAASTIALINEIRNDLAKVEADLAKLTGDNGTAKQAKANFDAVKGNIDNIKNQINGRPASQNITKIESILELLGNATNNTITNMVGQTSDASTGTSLNAQVNKLWEDLNAAPVVETARKDVPASDGVQAKDGLDTRCENLLDLVNDYRTKAKNEAKNQANYDAWTEWLKNPYNATKPEEIKSAQQIIDENKLAIDEAKAGETSPGELYFLGELAKKQTAYNNQGTAVTSMYNAKLQAPNSAFTDPEKNLTDANLQAAKKAVLDILNTVKTYPGSAKENEEAYAAQGNKYDEVLNAYTKLRVAISSSTPSGDNFTEAYNKALLDLKEIKDKLEKYASDRDVEYKAGNSEGFDSKVNLSTIEAINQLITDLDQKWNGIEEDGVNGDYKDAIIADNAQRYQNFRNALDELKAAYYGTTNGTDHTDGAVDLVSKLSKLSYAEKVDPVKYEEYVSGPNGIYAYADKITKLEKDAEENKANTQAPTFWDMDETFKADAQKLQGDIESTKDKYAALVNEVAKEIYQTKSEEVAEMLDDARTDLLAVGLATDEAKANKLIDAIKFLELEKGIVTIYNEAVVSFNNGTPKADFAIRLDNEFLPAFKETASLIAEAKDKAAKDDWKVQCDKVNTVQDAADMKNFMWNANYSSATDLTTFTKGTAPADFAFNKIEGVTGFANYDDAMTAYNNAVQTREIPDGSGVYQTHTKEYWAAYNSNEAYKVLKDANDALQAVIKNLNDKLNNTEANIKSLLVEHDATLNTLIDKYRGQINELNTVENEIEADIVRLDATAILKEMQAVNIELNNMRSYIELNIADADKKALIEKTNTLQTKNEKTYNAFNVGVGTPAVKTSAAETYKAYKALEKEIGTLKSSFDETVANAAETVANAITALEGRYTELENQYNATFQQTQTHYTNEFKAIMPQIDAVKAKVAEQGSAISIEKDNNLKAIKNVEAAIEKLSQDLAAYDQGYINNREFVNEQLKRLEIYEATLAYVVDQGQNLKNKKEGETTDLLYVEEQNDILDKDINGYTDSKTGKHVDGIKDRLNKLINIVKDASYTANKNAEEQNVKNINTDIIELQKDILKYDLNVESYNVSDEIHRVQTEINNRLLNTALQTDLTGKVNEEKINKKSVDEFKSKVVNEGYWNADGTEWIPVDIVKEHDGVMDSYNTILTALSDIEDEIITPGAITDQKEVQGADIELMIQFILGLEEPTADQAKAADINGGGIDVSDLTMLLNKLVYNNYNGYQKPEQAARMVATSQSANTLGMMLNTSMMNVTFDTEMSFAAMQFDVTLPAGVSLTNAAFAGNVDGVSAHFNKIGDHTWRVLLYSEENSNMVDGNALANISLNGQGVGTVTISNVKASTARGALVHLAGISDDFEITTGITNTEENEGKSIFYDLNGMVKRSIDKGVTIVKSASGKVMKVLKSN